MSTRLALIAVAALIAFSQLLFWVLSVPFGPVVGLILFGAIWFGFRLGLHAMIRRTRRNLLGEARSQAAAASPISLSELDEMLELDPQMDAVVAILRPEAEKAQLRERAEPILADLANKASLPCPELMINDSAANAAGGAGAFATSDGQLVMAGSKLGSVDDTTLRAVLGHELAHLALKHTQQSLWPTVTVPLGLVVVGVLGAPAWLPVLLPLVVLNSVCGSIELIVHEPAADRYAVESLGCDREALLGYLRNELAGRNVIDRFVHALRLRRFLAR